MQVLAKLGKEAGGLNVPVIVKNGSSDACKRMRDDMDDNVVVLCVLHQGQLVSKRRIKSKFDCAGWSCGGSCGQIGEVLVLAVRAREEDRDRKRGRRSGEKV